MNLRQLEAFQEVMVTGSVSAAARSLGRTQPAISALIAALEESVGCALFERRGGRLHPLAEAHFLFDESRDIPERIDRLRLTMRGSAEAEMNTLRIASMPGPSVVWVPEVISHFSARYEEVRFVMLSRASTVVRQLVANQSADLGIVDLGGVDSDLEKPLVQVSPFHMNCVCALRGDDPLAARDVISPKDLDARPMALLLPNHLVNRRCRKAFHDAGAALNTRFQTEAFIPHLTLVGNGAAYSILDPLTAAAYETTTRGQGNVVFRPLAVEIKMEIALLKPTFASPNPMADLFLDWLADEIADVDARFSPGGTYR
jgi:DNA-binding transcriptional LysR family regulator